MENSIIDLIDNYGIFQVFTFGEVVFMFIVVIASFSVGIYVIVDLIKDEIFWR